MTNQDSNGLTTEKLYSPLEFYLHDPREEEANGEYGMYDLYDDRYIIPHEDVLEHEDAVELALLRDRDRMDTTHGLAEYAPDELREKLWSLFPNIEYHGNSLWCAAAMELTAPLTPEETARLKDWWSGQLSDGWGEGLEQREIKVGREELYIVPWSSGDSFFVDTEREFRQRLGLEPPVVAVPDSDSPVSDELRQTLEDRLDRNLSDFHSELLGRSKQEIIDMAWRMSAMYYVHSLVAEDYDFTHTEATGLLRLQNPLEAIAYMWAQRIEGDVSFAIEDALADNTTASHFAPEPEPAPAAPLVQRREDGTTSVLDAIRRARENPPEAKPKDHQPGHKKSGHDL